MRFKGEVVWVRADDTGNLVTDGSGRAEMKYRETDDKSYRPFAGNLSPDDGTLPEPARSFAAGGQSMPLARKSTQNVEMRVRKPTGGGHGGH